MNLTKLSFSTLAQLIFCISVINAGLIFKRDVAIDTTTETNEATTTLLPIESETVTDTPSHNNELTTVFNHDEAEEILITTFPSISNVDEDTKIEINRTTTPKNLNENIQEATTAKNDEEIETTTQSSEIEQTTLKLPRKFKNSTRKSSKKAKYSEIGNDNDIATEEIETTTQFVEVETTKLPRKSRNSTRKSSKKAKYLDIENDNNFAAEIYALAMMNVGGSATVSEEQTTTMKPDDTLKALADWTQIVNLDNSSLVNAVTSDGVDLKSQKIVVANELVVSTTAESVLSSIVQTTSVPPTIPDEDNKIDTPAPTVKRKKKIKTTTTPEPSTTEEDNLEDFKFSKYDEITTRKNVQRILTVTPTSSKSQELTNSIIETTENEKVVTTVRPLVTSIGYEVSENVEEGDYLEIVIPKSSQMTTTEHLETTTPTTTELLSPVTMPVTTFRNTPSMTTTTEAPEKSTEAIRTTRETVISTTTPSPLSSSSVATENTTQKQEEETTVLPPTTTQAQDYDDITTTMLPTTESNDLIVSEVVEKITNSDNETIIENNSDIQVEQETTTEEQPQIETTTLNFVEIKPLSTTVQTLESVKEEITTNPSPSVKPVTETEIVVSEIDEKNKYNTVNEDTTVKPQNMDNTSTTEQTVNEEESITEDDYILVTVPSGTSTVSTFEAEPEDENGSSVAIAITASVLGVVAAIMVVIVLFVLKKRQNQVAYAQRCRPVGLDAYSLDNVSVYNSVRRKGNTMRLSKRSYGNSAFEDPGLKSNVLTVADLAMVIQSKTAIYDEFKEIPQITVRPDEVPDGCEDRNRYANVIPLPETRVHLKRLNDDEKTEYINANFVKGPKDSSNYYIACQAPMENTITDFWRMIWEQNSKVIIMATDLSENGVEKCADYLPPSVVLDNVLTFGDFTITLKNRENKEKYSLSTVHLKNAQTNTWREIMHFWYQWPDTGVPTDENTVITMLLEARSFLRLTPHEQSDIEQTSLVNGTSIVNNNNNSNNVNNSHDSPSIISNGSTIDKHRSLQRTQGPLTVHCSPGTGRTGTIIACDIALRVLEIPPRNIDIPQIVYNIRRGRASSVRTREQYEFIYRVANVYATKLTGPNIEN